MARENMPNLPCLDSAFARVFEDHVRFVWRVLEHHGVRGNDVEDATQEVFVVVARKLAELDDEARIRSWLYSIARRVASSHRRKAHVRREQLMNEPPSGSVEAVQHDYAEHSEAMEQLRSVLQALSEEQRMAFLLREVEQLTIQAVADAMGCPLQTAYSRVQAARKHVIAAFQEPGAHEVPHAG